MIVTTTDRLTTPAGTELRVAGELDTYAADELRRHLRGPAVPRSGAVVVDLAGVTFMSCTALAVLAEARRRLGPRLLLGGRSRVVIRLLDITGLASYFPVLTANDPAPEFDDHSAADGGTPTRSGTEARAWAFSSAGVEARLRAPHDQPWL